MPGWPAAGQTKIRCKLGVQRIRTVIQKNEALAKRGRRELATLLETGKIDTARIRTESLILQDTHNELLELLELYLELILARFGLLEISSKDSVPPEGLEEAIASIVYAAPRCEVRELHIIREAFMARYGRDWAIGVMDNTNSQVPARIITKCKTETPPKDWVDLYLYEIAKAYSVDWRPEGFVDLEHPAEDTAAQEERIVEATMSSDPVNGVGKSDAPGGGGSADSLLPAAPSSDPKLGDVKNSTTAVPIIKAEVAPAIPATPAKAGGAPIDLPITPPMDPTQAAKTIVIKSNIGQVKKDEAKPTSPDSYNDLAKRFEALKRK